MDEVEVVEEGYAAQQLPSKGLDMRARERYEAALLEEVEHGEAEERCDDANVTSPVEAIPELDTSISVGLVGGSQCL